MSQPEWTIEAAAAFSLFHRAALAVGVLAVILLLLRHWAKLNSLSGPFGHVLGGSLAAFAIPEASFPLYWIIIRGRPVSDISSQFLGVYVYIGAALLILVSIVGLRESWKRKQNVCFSPCGPATATASIPVYQMTFTATV